MLTQLDFPDLLTLLFALLVLNTVLPAASPKTQPTLGQFGMRFLRPSECILRLIYRTCVQMTHGCKQISRACSSVVGAK